MTPPLHDEMCGEFHEVSDPWAEPTRRSDMRPAPAPVISDLSRRGAVVGALLAATSPIILPAAAFDNRLPPDELELKYKSPRTPARDGAS